MKIEKKRRHFGLLQMFVLVLFFSGLINSGITTLIVYLLVRSGVLMFASDMVPDAGKLMLMSAAFSVPIGLMVSVMISKVPLKPVRDLIDGMDQLAAGNFKTRVKVGPVMRRYPAYVDVSDSFNKMAKELEGTEMLRSDFINNFSHEFKTPIVSIAGFAKLLRHGNPTPEQQQEYLKVIEEESMRLSAMATNVLNMTKVESQTILTDVTQYNLSEQVRSAILLLENEWDEKKLVFNLRVGEYQICGNEELLKHVWINLLDNAVKFSEECGSIDVGIEEMDDCLVVSISNGGRTIPPESLNRIFNKFYQADESHSTKGNGIGLAVVKCVVALHNGTVSVRSEQGLTTFTVSLPKEPLA